MSQTPNLSIVLPAYREAETIEEALNKIYKELNNLDYAFEIIVVVDGITDSTVDVLETLNLPNLRTIVLDVNQGKGAALRIGILSAKSNLYIGFMDADLDLEPWSIAAGIELLDKNPDIDLVVGSKLHPNSKIRYPLFRKFQSHLYRILVSRLFDLRISDTQTGIKVGKTEVIKQSLPGKEINGFAFDLSLLVTASKLNFKISEVPIELNYQFESSVRLRSAVETIIDTLKVYWQSRGNG